MNDSSLRCTACRAGLPVASAAFGKAAGAALFSLLGLRVTRDPVQRALMALLGLWIGHVADVVVTRLSRPICAACALQRR